MFFSSRLSRPAQWPPCTGQVVLDPGHGGTDSGAVNTKYKLNGKDLTEKDQILDVATRLKALLENDGYTVCMTRTTDKTFSNNDRYTYANTTGAFLSLST
ncbi:MAG TPA: N-acetylmuramoyl-L-alanine amidase [Rubrobacter sp.]